MDRDEIRNPRERKTLSSPRQDWIWELILSPLRVARNIVSLQQIASAFHLEYDDLKAGRNVIVRVIFHLSG